MSQQKTLSTPQDNATVKEDEKPITKGERMRQADRKGWLDQELKRMEPCSGAPKHKMRIWVTRLRAARKRFSTDLTQPIHPERSAAHVTKKWIQKLIVATCSGELMDTVDNYYEEFSESTSTTRLSDHLPEVYLGTDNKDAVITELASMSQIVVDKRTQLLSMQGSLG